MRKKLRQLYITLCWKNKTKNGRDLLRLLRLLVVTLNSVDIYNPRREDGISSCSNSNVCHCCNIHWRSKERPNKWQLVQRSCVLEQLPVNSIWISWHNFSLSKRNECESVYNMRFLNLRVSLFKKKREKKTLFGTSRNRLREMITISFWIFYIKFPFSL